MGALIKSGKSIVVLLAFVTVAAFSQSSKAEVWAVENQWSDEWEQKYKDWIQTTPDSKFFSNPAKADGTPNPYYGIRVDCADLVYSLRIIFSFENKLPFAMHNPANLNGSLITNSIKRYDKLPEGAERLKVFLTWIYDIVGSHTIQNDTYPVAFKDIGPGVVIVTTTKNHHSWTIRKISKSGNPTLIFNSTVFRNSGFDVQERQSWPNPYWVFEPEIDPADETKSIPVYVPGSYAGFRYWKPIDQMKTPAATLAKYSDEQFTVGIGKWKTAAVKALSTVPETIDQTVLRLLKDACSDLNQRVQAVADAEQYKTDLAQAIAGGATAADNSYVQDIEQDKNRPSDLRCMIAKSFDQFSTPSRDRRFLDALVLARAYFQAGIKKGGEKSFNPENLRTYKTIFPFIGKSAAEEAALDNTAKAARNFCSVKLNTQLGFISLAEVKRRSFKGHMSSNPNDSMAGRFGFSKTAGDLAESCPAYDLGPSTVDLDNAEAEANKEVSAAFQNL